MNSSEPKATRMCWAKRLRSSQGGWTISETNRINVADEIFEEWGPEAEWLKVRHNKQPIYKEAAQLRPAERHLNWHRKNVFDQ